MSRTDELYGQLVTELRQIALLSSCSSVLGWDEQTYLPEGGTEHRANQLSLLAGLTHERATAPLIGELLDEIESADGLGDPDGPRAVNTREARRDYNRARRLPRELIEEMSRTATLSQQAWIESRHRSDFSHFQPWLEKMVGLKREEAAAIGYGDGIPYDALLDDYEPGMTAGDVEAVFSPLRDALVPLVAAIRDSGREPDIQILTRTYPVDVQRRLGLQATAGRGPDEDPVL